MPQKMKKKIIKINLFKGPIDVKTKLKDETERGSNNNATHIN
jgi:hypothetical protein